jgi:hypothetical protein
MKNLKLDLYSGWMRISLAFPRAMAQKCPIDSLQLEFMGFALRGQEL